MGPELSHGQASDWHIDWHTHTHTQTQAMTIPEGQNWPRVKNHKIFGETHNWYDFPTVLNFFPSLHFNNPCYFIINKQQKMHIYLPISWKCFSMEKIKVPKQIYYRVARFHRLLSEMSVAMLECHAINITLTSRNSLHLSHTSNKYHTDFKKLFPLITHWSSEAKISSPVKIVNHDIHYIEVWKRK